MTVKKLIKWSRSEFSQLPWRQNRSLYRTLVSEIMLQQTTVSTVKNHFERFLTIFPDLPSLAQATEEELLVAWKGLGYYRRARNLKKIAEALMKEYRGEFPESIESLMRIPGIGPYTSSAILGIGMDKRALAVDANLERVIARFYGIKEMKGIKLQKKIQELFQAGKIFPDDHSARGLNEALMDLGRTFCQARKASCELCLLKRDCKAFGEGKPLLYPLASEEKRPVTEHELHLVRFYIVKSGKLLVYKKDDHEWLSGQYEVPTFILSSTDRTLVQYPKLEKLEHEVAANYKTGITKYKIQNSVVVSEEKALKKLKFTRELVWRELHAEESNFSTATLKGLKHLVI